MLTAAAAPSKARPARGAIRAAKGLIPPSSPPPYPKKIEKEDQIKYGFENKSKIPFYINERRTQIFLYFKMVFGIQLNCLKG